MFWSDPDPYLKKFRMRIWKKVRFGSVFGKRSDPDLEYGRARNKFVLKNSDPYLLLKKWSDPDPV